MAIKISAGDVKRGEFFFVDPNEIEVREDLRGRLTAPTREQIEAMALSLLEHGQRQPVECRRIEGNRLCLTMGFTRTEAAKLLRAGFESTEAGDNKKLIRDPEFRLKVLVSDTNEKEAFLHNVVENCHRNQTSAIDDAFNQRRLREHYGMNDTDIARLYQKTAPYIIRLRKLLSLPDTLQSKVHSGELSVAAALDLLDLPAANRDDALAAATTVKGKVNTSKLRAQVRDFVVAEQEKQTPVPSTNNGHAKTKGKSTGKPSAKPRTLAEIKNTLQLFSEDHADRGVRELCDYLLGFLQGSVSVKRLRDNITRIVVRETVA